MARISKEGTSIDFNQVRGMVRNKIIEKYGGVSKFLKSDKGKEFGGLKIKIYLYDTGPVNFELISSLCKFFGIGELSRKIVVSRSYYYRLNKTTVSE